MRRSKHRGFRWLAGALVLTTALGLGLAAPASAAPAHGNSNDLTRSQRSQLSAMAAETWNFFKADVDPKTHLPLDNLGPGSTRGAYTSAANVGVYLWSIVSAKDLGLISRAEADRMVTQTLTTVNHLKRTYGFLYQWYDTSTGAVLTNPGEQTCATETTPAQDNCYFLSAVDNGWYASGLVIARQALPETSRLATSLLDQMDFSIFYDNRAQTNCNTNANIEGNQPTGQMYGGYYVDQGPAGYHNGALYSDPRIAMYMGMGLKQMPGDVWWRTWRTLPPKRCSTDPDNSFQGQWPPQGKWVTVTDPLSHKKFPVWEGHYTYPDTKLNYLPTFGGGMFEGLMANLVVPETSWGKQGFGEADRLTPAVQILDAAKLGYPVWGMSPSSTADDTGDYGAFGAAGLSYPTGKQLAQCPTCNTETTVTPHASFLALTVDPQVAFANIQKLRSLYPGIYSKSGGFYDAVNPVTGQVGHRRLVLDQSMIMASLDNALNHNALQRYFAQDRTSWAARAELGVERMTITGA